MLIRLFILVLTIGAVVPAVVANAQEPGKVDIEAAEMVAAAVLQRWANENENQG